MANDLDRFIAAHKASCILPIDPWTSRDTRTVKSVTTLEVRRLRTRADGISDGELRQTLTGAIDAFTAATRDLDERFPDMTVAGFADWAVIRLREIERTRLVPLGAELMALLDEEMAAIQAILENPAATTDDVLDFVVFYDDEKDGFVRRFNDAVEARNRDLNAGAAQVERQSTELSGGFAHLVWGVLSFAVLGLAVYQMLTGREWVSITMGGALAAFLAVWLLSELVRLPADRHYTRKLFARWSRRRLDTPMTVQADAESRSDLYTRGAIRALGSLNGEQVRRELRESGRVSRRTLRQISRDENGPLADAPALFARQHELDPLPTLRADVNVEGFFAWARARIASIVDTKEQTVNAEITALLDEELRRINSVLTLADAATPTDVNDFTAWYNEPSGGYVERHNRAVDAYNRGIRHAVAAVRLRSTAAAAAAALAGVAGLVYLTIHGNLTQNLLDAASQVGSASLSTMRDVVIWSAVAATVLIGWKTWSGLSRWSMRCAHVNWNRRHPDHMLVLPGGHPRPPQHDGPPGRT